MKEAVVLTCLALWLILIYIFDPRKGKACYPMSNYRRGIPNSICDLVLCILSEG